MAYSEKYALIAGMHKQSTNLQTDGKNREAGMDAVPEHRFCEF